MIKIFTLVLLVFIGVPVFAQWNNDPTVNNPICTINGSGQSSYAQQMISDGNGGSIIAWQDARNGSYAQIYVQKINASGVVQWATNGVIICPTSSVQTYPQLVSDGAGGAIVTWLDNRNSSNTGVYAQKINSAGNVQWAASGVAIYGGAGGVQQMVIVGDGTGGAIIAWNDARNNSATATDLFAQRINAAGRALWTTNGVIICNAANTQTYPKIISDGSSGAIITWMDARNTSTTYIDIFAQRINAAGSVLWTANGVVVCNSFNGQVYPQMTSDGSGGAIIAWQDDRYATYQGTYQLFAERINSSGTSQWSSNGVAVCDYTFAYIQNSPQIIGDAAGGAIIAWTDGRSGNSAIYSQRLSSSGYAQWTVNGVALSILPSDLPAIINDGLGGAIVAWRDRRNGNSNMDVYAQRVNSAGLIQWTNSGTAICTAINSQSNVQLISDGQSGAIGSWEDLRNASYNNLYASRINNLGVLPVSLVTFTAALKNKQINLNWTTATETKNKGFDVEKSADAVIFEKIGFVPGHGTSTQQLLYNFTDVQPLFGKNYYRLKQIDLDGKFTYSGVVEVINLAEGSSLKVYPNPAINNINITTTGITGNVQIMDMAGRVLQKALLTGNSTIVDVRSLSAGSYICKIGSASVMFLKR